MIVTQSYFRGGCRQHTDLTAAVTLLMNFRTKITYWWLLKADKKKTNFLRETNDNSKNLHDVCKSHGFLNPISLRCMTHLRHFTVNFLLTLRIIPKFINSHLQNSIDKWIRCLLLLLLVYLMIVLFHFVGLDGSFLFPAKSFLKKLKLVSFLSNRMMTYEVFFKGYFLPPQIITVFYISNL